MDGEAAPISGFGDTKQTIMSKATAIIRYDGPALAEHSMDVSDLAPALLGLSEIAKIANRQINGEQSSVKVFISVDTEQKCFQFNIEIAQTLLQHVSLILHNGHVATAKDIAEWIGIIGSSTFGVFKAYKWIVKQKVTLTELSIKDVGGNVVMTNVDNSVTINKHAYYLMGDPDVIRNVKNVVKPLTKEGYDKLQFEKEGEVVDEISAAEGQEIYAMNAESLEVQQLVNKTTFPAKVKVKKPDLLGDSQWSFIFHKAIVAKIEDVGWLERFHSAEISILPGSYLDVMLRMEIALDDKRDPIGEPKYYITEVKAVIPPNQQAKLFK